MWRGRRRFRPLPSRASSPATRTPLRSARTGPRGRKSLNFRPNAVARSLRTTDTRTVGLVVSDLMNPFFTELARAVEETARAAGFSPVGDTISEPHRPAQSGH